MNVESKGALTLGFVSSGDIYASDYSVGGGAINLTSDTSDVTVYDYGLYAGGDVNITSGSTASSSVGGNIYVHDTYDI